MHAIVAFYDGVMLDKAFDTESEMYSYLSSNGMHPVELVRIYDVYYFSSTHFLI